jgi:hypothetical protein
MNRERRRTRELGSRRRNAKPIGCASRAGDGLTSTCIGSRRCAWPGSAAADRRCQSPVAAIPSSSFVAEGAPREPALTPNGGTASRSERGKKRCLCLVGAWVFRSWAISRRSLRGFNGVLSSNYVAHPIKSRSETALPDVFTKIRRSPNRPCVDRPQPLASTACPWQSPTVK